MSRGDLRLGRRTLLRGMVGGSLVSLGLPVLEAMLDTHGEAFADGSAPPVRFMTWFFGDGAASADIDDPDGRPLFAPAQTGPDYPLTAQLAGLADVRAYCSVLSGFRIGAATPEGRPHHAGLTGFLSGYEYLGNPPTTTFGGPTIDHVLGDLLGRETYLPSLQISATKWLSDEGATVHDVSAVGPMLTVPSLTSPQEIWNLLFGTFADSAAANAPARLARVDAVMEDLAALEQRLGVADRLRLEQHFDGLVQLSQQIDALPPVCAMPDVPEQENVDVDFAEPLSEINAVMSDLVAYAFACDITRVVNYRFSSSLGGTTFSEIGQTSPRHLLTHFADAGLQQRVDEGIVYIVERFAATLERFRQQSEGASNLLDNACVVLGTDCGVGYHHSISDVPCIVAGRGGGALVHPGIHYRTFADETTSDIMLTCARAAAPELESFGGGPDMSTTEVDALRA